MQYSETLSIRKNPLEKSPVLKNNLKKMLTLYFELFAPSIHQRHYILCYFSIFSPHIVISRKLLDKSTLYYKNISSGLHNIVMDRLLSRIQFFRFNELPIKSN